jgi:NodT family efflux transporter outer membrane factor (OMF) lipoprotein
MRTRRIELPILFLGVLLILSGCAVGPDFHNPPAPKTERYTKKPLPPGVAVSENGKKVVQTFSPGSDIPGEWWTLFHSKTLNSLVKQSLKSNPNLQAAEASLLEAMENVGVGEGSFLPSGTGSLNTNQQFFNGAAFGAPYLSSLFTLNTANVSVTYTLDVFGGIRRQVESLKALAEYQRYQLEAAYLTLTSNIVLTAIQEASYRTQIDATRQIVDVLVKELSIVQRQFDLGYASRAAVLTQETVVAQEKALLPALEKQLSIARHQMAVYLGRFPNEKIGDDFRLDNLTLPGRLPVSLPSKLIEHRPDIRSAEEQLHSASAQIGVATANMLPQVSLTGNYGSESLNGYFAPGSQFWAWGPTVSNPIFQEFTLFHQRKAAIAAFQKAKAQYKNAVLQAFQNVADTLRALQSDAETLNAQTDAERAAEESLRISERQFSIGAIGYPDLYNAQRNYQQALINLVQARAGQYADTVALFQALGGGWWNLAKPAPKSLSLAKAKTAR